jgi:hypothetical protein
MTRFNNYLTETWIESYHGTPIWENPTSSDLKEMNIEWEKYFRFTAMPKKKKVWVWPGNIIHGYIYDKFNLGGGWKNRDQHLLGTAEMKGGKLHMVDSDEIDGWIEDIMAEYEPLYDGKVNWTWLATKKVNWNWLHSYVDCRKWLAITIRDIKNLIKQEKIKEDGTF